MIELEIMSDFLFLLLVKLLVMLLESALEKSRENLWVIRWDDWIQLLETWLGIVLVITLEM